MERLTTRETAERAGVNAQTVRYYEREGLIPEPPRTASEYRQFQPEHFARIRFIRRAQKLGFTLREVKELLALRAAPGAKSGDVKRYARSKIDDIRARIEDLTRIRNALDDLVAACEAGSPTAACPILHALEEREV
jgi:Hg(II)-responsive transcriptional regulator